MERMVSATNTAAKVTKFSAEELQSAMEKADRILRPTVCMLHQDVLEDLKKQDPDIEKKYVFYSSEFIDKDKIYAMSRESFEDMTKNAI